MFRFRQCRLLHVFIAVIVMTQLMLVHAMAVSAELHCHLHDHSGDASHECAVTLLLSGGYDSLVPDITPVDFVQDAPLVVMTGPHSADAVPSHLVGGVLAHAPPRGP